MILRVAGFVLAQIIFDMALDKHFNSPQNKKQMSKAKTPAKKKPVARKEPKKKEHPAEMAVYRLPVIGEILEAVGKEKNPHNIDAVYEVLTNDAKDNKRTEICRALKLATSHYREKVAKVLRKHNL